MPYQFDVDVEKRLIKRKVWGVYTDAECLKSAAEFRLIPRAIEFNELHDMVEIQTYAVSSQVLSQVAKDSSDRKQPSHPHKKVAFVVATSLMHGMIRVYMGNQGGTKEEIKIFTSLEEAYFWLSAPMSPGVT